MFFAYNIRQVAHGFWQGLESNVICTGLMSFFFYYFCFRFVARLCIINIWPSAICLRLSDRWSNLVYFFRISLIGGGGGGCMDCR